MPCWPIPANRPEVLPVLPPLPFSFALEACTSVELPLPAPIVVLSSVLSSKFAYCWFVVFVLLVVSWAVLIHGFITLFKLEKLKILSLWIFSAQSYIPHSIRARMLNVSDTLPGLILLFLAIQKSVFGRNHGQLSGSPHTFLLSQGLDCCVTVNT